MKISKEMLIRLFQSNNSKRKAALFENFQAYFSINLTAAFIAEMINADLGSALVNENDVKYCRRHFVGKVQRTKKNEPMPLPQNNVLIKKIDAKLSTEIVWTDPDEVPISNNKFQTKYFKKP